MEADIKKLEEKIEGKATELRELRKEFRQFEERIRVLEGRVKKLEDRKYEAQRKV